jgi:tRNA (guanine37-N1)-methyltransferase
MIMKTSFLKRYLADKLPPEDLAKVSKSFDVVGDIAILKIPPALEHRKELIAEAILTENKSVKTVLHQQSPVAGVFRTRTLEYVAGETKTETLYREYGCVFKVDLAEVYFSPRLSFERIRVGTLIGQGETVVNMFAGVGCFSIIIAKHSPAWMVYSIDLNPVAVQLMRENIGLNRMQRRVEAICGDARKVVAERFLNAVDRVVMPLPEKAYEYLGIAVKALQERRGVVHYYDFIHAGRGESPIDKGVDKVDKKLRELGVKYVVTASRIVRMVGPRWYQIALDMHVDSL